MLSTLGMDSKTSRVARPGPGSKYLEIPRGFSVHIFKNPAVATHTHNATSKVELNHTNRLSAESRPVSKPPAGSYPTRPEFDRKGSLTSSEYRNAPATVFPPVQRSRSKLGKSYGIYPSSVGDMYIYERSISSASDLLASSPSSSSSDSDTVSENAASTALEISSTRASSSTETLEATLSANRNAPVTTASAPSATAKPIPPPTTVVRAAPNGSAASAVGPLVRAELPANRDTSSRPLPIVLAGVAGTESDSDSDTVFDDPTLDMLAAPSQRPPALARQDSRHDQRTAPTHPTPIRRGSDERPPYQATRRRDSIDDQARPPALSAPSVKYAEESASRLRAPPGLPIAPAAVRSNDPSRQLPTASSPPSTQPSSQVAPSSSPPVRVPASSRLPDGVPPSAVAFPRTGEPKANSAPPPIAASLSTRPALSRSESTGQVNIAFAADGPSVAISKRCVRWTEALVCPSPIPKEQRRKGWFNCRGDQLWTNDGKYKSPEPGKEYPPDLAGYPEPNAGWQNEEGTRIDMHHRLVPKAPLRSALKRQKGAQ